MLDIMGYDATVSVSKSIVDLACGTGTFVKQIIDRFIDGLYKNGITNTFKERLLNDKLIRAYDTKPSNVFVTKIVMISALIKRNLIRKMSDVLVMVRTLPVYCQDFLSIEENADFIIGKPTVKQQLIISNKKREQFKGQVVFNP